MAKRRVEGRVDLLSLTAAERLRVCKEIRAALKRKVATAKLHVADDVAVDERAFDDRLDLPNRALRDCASVNPQRKASVLNSLLKHVW
jgi:hypothetical protein